MGELAADQIRDANVDIGDVVKLVDLGGGSPGLPVLDGSQLQNLPGTTVPGQFVLGSPLIYPSAGFMTAEEVQYTRVFLAKGAVLDRMRCFTGSITGGSKTIRMGIYSQTSPLNSNGIPATRVAQTNAVTAVENAANVVSLTSAYTVPTSGYYWLAFVRSSGGGALNLQQTSSMFPASFLSAVVRYENTTGTTLPATVGTLTSPAGAVIYVATLEQ